MSGWSRRRFGRLFVGYFWLHEEGAADISAPLDLTIEALDGIVGLDLGPLAFLEGGVGEDVLFGSIQQVSEFLHLWRYGERASWANGYRPATPRGGMRTELSFEHCLMTGLQPPSACGPSTKKQTLKALPKPDVSGVRHLNHGSSLRPVQLWNSVPCRVFDRRLW
jgi:hypothetical protein